MRLVIAKEKRNAIHTAAVEAAFEANDGREVSYTTEKLIEAAIEAAISKTEELLA